MFKIVRNLSHLTKLDYFVSQQSVYTTQCDQTFSLCFPIHVLLLNAVSMLLLTLLLQGIAYQLTFLDQQVYRYVFKAAALKS